MVGKGDDSMADAGVSSYDGFMSYSHAADGLLAPHVLVVVATATLRG